jgi:hypothetical protein
MMHNVEHSIGRLTEIMKRGVRLSMDDFGAGYSSMALIKRFPIDKLWICPILCSVEEVCEPGRVHRDRDRSAPARRRRCALHRWRGRAAGREDAPARAGQALADRMTPRLFPTCPSTCPVQLGMAVDQALHLELQDWFERDRVWMAPMQRFCRGSFDAGSEDCRN